jgi:hypothetical protein
MSLELKFKADCGANLIIMQDVNQLPAILLLLIRLSARTNSHQMMPN